MTTECIEMEVFLSESMHFKFISSDKMTPLQDMHCIMKVDFRHNFISPISITIYQKLINKKA